MVLVLPEVSPLVLLNFPLWRCMPDTSNVSQLYDVGFHSRKSWQSNIPGLTTHLACHLNSGHYSVHFGKFSSLWYIISVQTVCWIKCLHFCNQFTIALYHRHYKCVLPVIVLWNESCMVEFLCQFSCDGEIWNICSDQGRCAAIEMFQYWCFTQGELNGDPTVHHRTQSPVFFHMKDL